jgi:hypothetical protein
MKTACFEGNQYTLPLDAIDIVPEVLIPHSIDLAASCSILLSEGQVHTIR